MEIGKFLNLRFLLYMVIYWIRMPRCLSRLFSEQSFGCSECNWVNGKAVPCMSMSRKPMKRVFWNMGSPYLRPNLTIYQSLTILHTILSSLFWFNKNCYTVISIYILACWGEWEHFQGKQSWHFYAGLHSAIGRTSDWWVSSSRFDIKSSHIRMWSFTPWAKLTVPTWP